MISLELKEALKTRRSIRKFKTDPVPRELLDSLLKEALWAPSAMNTQPWKIFVLTGEKMKELTAITSRSVEYMDGRLRAMFNEKMQHFIRGYFKDYGGAPALVVVLTSIPEHEVYLQASYQSSAAALYNFLLLAHEAGLSTCWMTGQIWMEKEVLEYLGFPDGWRLVGMTPVGYADQNPPVPPRKHEDITWIE